MKVHVFSDAVLFVGRNNSNPSQNWLYKIAVIWTETDFVETFAPSHRELQFAWLFGAVTFDSITEIERFMNGEERDFFPD